MKNIRRNYALVMGLVLVLLFLFDSSYLIALFVIMCIFPIVLHFVLQWDRKKIHVEMEIRHSCQMGMNAPIHLTFSKKSALFAVSDVVVTFEWYNRMLGEKRTEKMTYPLLKKEEKVPIDVGFMCCGEMAISFIQVQCYDVFGLCSATIFKKKDMRILVFPMEVRMRVYCEEKEAGNQEDAWESLPVKGKDTNEVYDLRPYKPGDSIHAIHWKMSEKWDELIVKEPGDTLHTDALVLLDLGKKTEDDKKAAYPMISSTIAFAQICCQNLYENGIKFMAAYASEEKLHENAVLTRDELDDLFCYWLEVRMPEKNGTALKFLEQSQEQKLYSHIIYITIGKFPSSLFAMQNQKTRITAICIREDGEQIQAMEHQNIHTVEIPMAILQDSKNVIKI